MEFYCRECNAVIFGVEYLVCFIKELSVEHHEGIFGISVGLLHVLLIPVFLFHILSRLKYYIDFCITYAYIILRVKPK